MSNVVRCGYKTLPMLYHIGELIEIFFWDYYTANFNTFSKRL